MKDFTKKGTKLPVIPVGTKFRTVIERLAKEQGMCDDGITITFKQTEPFRVLELQPDLKVTFPCGHEITMQTNQFLTTNDCEQCKTNQMNPKVTLQENGTVTVTDTETITRAEAEKQLGKVIMD